MSFIDDGSTPNGKESLFPIPVSANPANYVRDSDWNALCQDMSDLRTAIIGGAFFGLVPQASVPTIPGDASTTFIWSKTSDGGLYYRFNGGTDHRLLTTADLSIAAFFNQQIQSNTSNVAQRTNLNFSSRFTLTDDSGNDRTTVDLPVVNASPGSYTAANITVDAYGRVTVAANGASPGYTAVKVNLGTALTSRAILNLSSNFSAVDDNTNTCTTVDLADTAVTAGSYTFAGITVDAKGRITAASSGSAVPTSRNLTAGTGLGGGGNLSADRTFFIDQSFSPVWSGNHTFTHAIQGGINSGDKLTLSANSVDSNVSVLVTPDADGAGDPGIRFQYGYFSSLVGFNIAVMGALDATGTSGDIGNSFIASAGIGAPNSSGNGGAGGSFQFGAGNGGAGSTGNHGGAGGAFLAVAGNAGTSPSGGNNGGNWTAYAGSGSGTGHDGDMVLGGTHTRQVIVGTSGRLTHVLGDMTVDGTLTATLSVSELSGVLPIANGGTNSSTTLNNNRIMQSSSGSIIEAAAITAARVLISDSNGIPTHASVTSTTLGYLDVTSSAQTQLDGMAKLAGRSGGQTLIGGTSTGQTLVLQDNSSDTTTVTITKSADGSNPGIQIPGAYWSSNNVGPLYVITLAAIDGPSVGSPGSVLIAGGGNGHAGDMSTAGANGGVGDFGGGRGGNAAGGSGLKGGDGANANYYGGSAGTCDGATGANGGNANMTGGAGHGTGHNGDVNIGAFTTRNVNLGAVSTPTNVLGSLVVTGTAGASNLSGTNTGDVSLSGENYLSISSQVITANAVDLSGTNATGILAAGRFPALTGDATTSAGSLSVTVGKINGVAYNADPLTQYGLLAGRSGGQTLIGGTSSGQTLILQDNTSDATTFTVTNVADGSNPGVKIPGSYWSSNNVGPLYVITLAAADGPSVGSPGSVFISGGGNGHAGDSSTAGAAGGIGDFGGGRGGNAAGGSGKAGGTGGNVNLFGGAAGTCDGATGANGGNANMVGGAGQGTGHNGDVNLGAFTTRNINLGTSSTPTNILGSLSVTGSSFSIFGGAGAGQSSAIVDASGGGVQDAEARTAINSLLAVMRTWGWVHT